jgi:hypothetical protein
MPGGTDGLMLFKEVLLKLSGTLVLLISCLTFAGSQVRSDSTSVTIMFYNVENAFDIYDDPATDDEEFLPDGLRRWNKTRYNKKIKSIYKTVSAAGGWEPPSVIAFCEIENRRVVEDLINETPLSLYNYGIIHTDSPDPRGIDVCMIYRKEIVKVLGFSTIIPRLEGNEEFHSRNILFVRCSILNESINLLVNHWPSRRGGVLSAESLRRSMADKVKQITDSICGNTAGIQKTIILGDFNCSPDDDLISLLTVEKVSPGCRFISLTPDIIGRQTGTYRYLGTWESPDQVFVSESLYNCPQGLYASKESCKIFDPDFLLSDDPNYPGKVPFSTFRGFVYQGGFSDHLPVILRLRLR